MNPVQSLQKRPQRSTPVNGEVVDAATAAPQNGNVTAIPGAPLQTCEHCDSLLDAQQRYCLNCGTRSRYVTNPAVDFLAAQRRRKALASTPVEDRGYGGTGITKKALPWVAASTVSALILGFLIGGIGGEDNNNEALLAALAKQPVATAAAAPTTAVGAVTIASDFTLDKGFAVQISTLPSTSDQAAVDAAKTAATGKGASDVGVINPADFTVKPDPTGNFVIYSGQFEKKSEAQAALKKLKKDFPDAQVVAVTSVASGDVADVLGNPEEGVSEALTEPVTKEKVAKDKKAVEDLNDKTGEEFVEGQDDLPDAIVNDDAPPATTPDAGTPTP